MTAITPAHAHAFQATCLTRRVPAVPRLKLPLAEAQSQIPAPSAKNNNIEFARNGNE